MRPQRCGAALQARGSPTCSSTSSRTPIPLQAEILLLAGRRLSGTSADADVCPVPGKLFVVGDPKQCIYRFGAHDVMLYERVKQHLLEVRASSCSLSPAFVRCPRSSRCVNAAFAAADDR